MSPRKMQTWQFVSNYQEQHGYGPTLREVGEHLGVTSLATARKRVQALIDEGYCDREKPGGRLRVLMVPATGLLRLDEALREAGEDDWLRCESVMYGPGHAFTREDVLRVGWEVVRDGEAV